MKNQENQLEKIVKDSNLESTKAKYILDNFKDYFDLASEWEMKAKTLVVTRDDQVAEMKMAREGRLFLREKRLAVESSRKKLKEQSLREGKAIDGIANVLKALIVPIEEHLDRQEHFVELKKKAAEEQKRLEIEQKIEQERLEREQKEAEEKERLRIENEKLRAESEAAERKRQEERRKQEAALEKERAKVKAAQDKAKREKEAREAKAREALRVEEEKRRKLEEELKSMVECPHCHKKFSLKKVVKA